MLKNQRDYVKSNAALEVDVAIDGAAAAAAGRLERALAAEDEALVSGAAQTLVDLLCDGAEIPRIPVKIAPQRKRYGRVEYYGWCGPKFITVYLRTARLGRFVAYRTFLKTLCHEFCHHYDWKALGMADSFHTRGFYTRVNIVYGMLAGDGGTYRPQSQPQIQNQFQTQLQPFRIGASANDL